MMKYIIPLFFISTQLLSQSVTPFATSAIDSTWLATNFLSTNNTIEISEYEIGMKVSIYNYMGNKVRFANASSNRCIKFRRQNLYY